MDELKNIRTFQEFKDSVNEEALWDAVKNLFSTIFGKIDKRFADAINNYTKKLDGTKNWEDAVKVFEETLGVVRNGLPEMMKEVKGPLGLRKLVMSAYQEVYSMCQILAKSKYQQKGMAPALVFKGTTYEKIFSYDKAADFEKNLLPAATAKIMEINKKFPAYDEKELNDYYTKYNKDMTTEEIKNIEGGEAAATGTTTGTEVPKKESTVFNYKDKLNELSAGEPGSGQPINTEQNKPAEQKPAEQINTTEQKPAEQPKVQPNQQQQNQGGVPKAKDPQKMTEMGNDVVRTINEELIGQSLKILKAIKPASKVGSDDAFLALSKDSKVSDNKDSIAKLMKAIRDLPPDKKPDLIRLRSELGKALGKTEDEMKKEYPL